MIESVIVSIFVLIISLKNLAAVQGLLLSRQFLKDGRGVSLTEGCKITHLLIIIPVLREQKVIESTLHHFESLKLSGMRLHIILAGTIRESKIDRVAKEKYTRDVVQAWIANFNQKSLKHPELTFEYVEADDPNGDRASQLTFAVQQFKSKIGNHADVIGVYDADSLPELATLKEVRSVFEDGAVCCQQPVHFNDAASNVAATGGKPVIVANALYQTTWTIIRELPRWFANSQMKIGQRYLRNIYLIGHGQFISPDIYEKFGFPSDEVTDGIQLGYRLGMSNTKILPLHTFCCDDIPRSVQQLVYQHKRWFGGCMRLIPAYDWTKTHCSSVSLIQLVDGFWSQFSWAWAGPFAIVAIVSSLFIPSIFVSHVLQISLWFNLFIYCYVIPLAAHRILGVPIKVRMRDWVALPLAILIKCIGPNLYFWESLLVRISKNRSMEYQKVER